MEMLKAVVTDFQDVYIFIDALDECPKAEGERETLLETITKIHDWGLASLHLFVTSRNEADIKESLDVIPTDIGYFKPIGVQGSHVKHDIELFLEQKFKERAFRNWKTDLKQEVKKKLASRANGM